MAADETHVLHVTIVCMLGSVSTGSIAEHHNPSGTVVVVEALMV